MADALNGPRKVHVARILISHGQSKVILSDGSELAGIIEIIGGNASIYGNPTATLRVYILGD